MVHFRQAQQNSFSLASGMKYGAETIFFKVKIVGESTQYMFRGVIY